MTRSVRDTYADGTYHRLKMGARPSNPAITQRSVQRLKSLPPGTRVVVVNGKDAQGDMYVRPVSAGGRSHLDCYVDPQFLEPEDKGEEDEREVGCDPSLVVLNELDAFEASLADAVRLYRERKTWGPRPTA
jgi:hypothetical protein